LSPDEPTTIDHWVRRHVSIPGKRRVSPYLAPLFPLGLPGGYIAIAYFLARSLRRRRRAGGPAIVTAAWTGWLVHRGLKLVFVRERPRTRGRRRRVDSYPSGHTAGTTALAVCVARILARDGLVSPRQASLVGIGAPLAMGLYRVIDDEHWATDVLGGWLLGASVALTCDALLSELGAAPTGATRAPAARSRAAHPRVHRARSKS
jgi:membrane-associated phospholipid phosphatase